MQRTTEQYSLVVRTYSSERAADEIKRDGATGRREQKRASSELLLCSVCACVLHLAAACIHIKQLRTYYVRRAAASLHRQVAKEPRCTRVFDALIALNDTCVYVLPADSCVVAYLGGPYVDIPPWSMNLAKLLALSDHAGTYVRTHLEHRQSHRRASLHCC